MTERVPAATAMTMMIELPVRDLSVLQGLAAAVSDPKNPAYRRSIPLRDIAERFGASAEDYQAVVAWAHAKGLEVVSHPNRISVEVTAPAATLEAAFHVHLRSGLRPDGTRFHAPDAEPALDLDVPIDHIGNLENYALRRAVPYEGGGGSGQSGAITGGDFRHAYASCTTATGAGQQVGIFAMDGFSQYDVNQYFSMLGDPATLPVQPNPSTASTSTVDDEGDLDVQMVLSMAPNAQVVAFEGGADQIFTNMSEAPNVKTLTSSFDTGPLSSAAQAALATMTTNLQTFFVASGDNGAYPEGTLSSTAVNIRQVPNVTVVGGTTLTMNSAGASYGTEVGWPGSGGGVNTFSQGGGQAIPSYQQGLGNGANQASSQYRNIPDVSAEAAWVQLYSGSGGALWREGTSAAAPLWAGFLALANQQAAAEGAPSPGFINPLLYSLAQSPAAYTAYFNDMTSGTNPALSNTSFFYSAVDGYDLVSGIGSPQCPLLYALADGGLNANQLYLSPGNNPLQTLQGGTGSANVLMYGPWQAADKGAGAVGVLAGADPIPGATITFGPATTIDGSGVVSMSVAATLSTPVGYYYVPVTVTDASSKIALTRYLEVEVLACQPSTSAEVCVAAGNGAQACGTHAAGCGSDTVDCGTCPGGAACTNGYCPCIPTVTSCSGTQTCGSIVNNCGQTIACAGTCGSGTACSGNLCCPSGEVNSNGVCCPGSETGSNGICCPSGDSNSLGHCCPTGELWSTARSECVSPASGGGCRCTKTECDCE